VQAGSRREGKFVRTGHGQKPGAGIEDGRSTLRAMDEVAYDSVSALAQEGAGSIVPLATMRDGTGIVTER